MLSLYCHPDQWLDALSLPISCGTSTFTSALLRLLNLTVNVDNEADLSVPVSSFLSCKCLRSTKGKLRQAEIATPLWTGHLWCVSYGHVALRARSNLRGLRNKKPVMCLIDLRMIQPQQQSTAAIIRSAYKSSTLSQFASSPLLFQSTLPTATPTLVAISQVLNAWVRHSSWAAAAVVVVGDRNCTWK